MKALFIGGTGLISTAVSKLAIERGWDLTLFNRGQHIHGIPEGANIVTVDINDDEAVRRAMEESTTTSSPNGSRSSPSACSGTSTCSWASAISTS